MAMPHVECTSQLVENGKYLYLPVAAYSKEASGLGRVDVLLRITKKMPGPDDLKTPGVVPDMLLTSVKVAFPELGTTRVYPVSLTLKDKPGHLNVFLDDVPDPILIDVPDPCTIKITLAFTGFDAVTFSWPLEAHRSSTPAESYEFPFRASELEQDTNGRYVTGGVHAGGQMFHNDFKIVGWDADRQQFVNTPGAVFDEVLSGQLVDDNWGENKDHLLWEKPVHAAGDGFVLAVADKWPDNPRPNQSMVYTSTAMALPENSRVLAVQECLDGRVLSVIADAENRLRMMSHRIGEGGESLTLEGISAPTVLPVGAQSMTTARVSGTTVVTAGHDNGSALMMLWSVTNSGAKIEHTDSVILPPTQAVKIETLGAGRFLMARQPATGHLEFSVWEVGGDALPQKAVSTTFTGGPTALFDTCLLTDVIPTKADQKSKTQVKRFVSAGLTGAGTLKVTAWRIVLINGKVQEILRKGSVDTGDKCVEISACTTLDGAVCVATRTPQGGLRIHFFAIDADGALTTTAVVEPNEKVSQVSVLQFKRGVATAVRTGDGQFRLIGWALLAGAPAKVRRSFTVDGSMDNITSLIQNNVTAPGQTATVAVGLTSASGSPRLLLCTLANPNTLHLLCGNERVFYAHLRHGSIPKKFLQLGAEVKKGETIALGGSSGQSNNPHLHMGVERLDLEGLVTMPGPYDEATKKLIIDKHAAGKIPALRRGMPFHGILAMLLTNLVPGGVKSNPFSSVNDQGIGSVDDQGVAQEYVIYPGIPRIPRRTDLSSGN